MKEVEKEKLITEDGSYIETDLTIWTAGIKGCMASSQFAGGNLNRGCIEVDDKLLIRSREDALQSEMQPM